MFNADYSREGTAKVRRLNGHYCNHIDQYTHCPTHTGRLCTKSHLRRTPALAPCPRGCARGRDGIVTALTACGVLDAGVAPRRQNVLMNSINARLSSSLNTGSVPNAFSSSLRPSVSLNFAVPK